MLKLEHTEVLGWEHVIRGMRNPMNSWAKSDSFWNYHPCGDCNGEASCVDDFHVGPNDYDLMTRLRNAGTDHRKFMRMITVYVDITGPSYFWKEFDTYKVGTVANSTSTMHKIHAKEFTLEDFSYEHLSDFSVQIVLKQTIDALNHYRNEYLRMAEKLKSKDLTDDERNQVKTQQKYYWWQMIQLLPFSYHYTRTVMMNYEVLANMYKSRRNHKLDEWHTFCDWIEGLPYSEIITGPKTVDLGLI